MTISTSGNLYEGTSVSSGEPPPWAVLQRRLLCALEEAAETYLDKYTNRDGSLVFRETFPPNPKHSRDAVDDFYESFYHLPLLYVLGGADWLLSKAKHHWEGVTAQLTRMGMLVDEFDRGYDWFHIGEGQLFFYGLCMASPDDPTLQARARRFAELYVEGANYDSELNLIRAPHTGSEGPRYGFYPPGDSIFVWRGSMEEYGLPLDGVPGVETFDALRHDPQAARRMGDAMDFYFGQGDVAVNLGITGLVANAFMLDADRSLRDWILRYAEGWAARAQENRGLLPDNVGPLGRVGELFEGRWYGGLYGWSWPHGFHSVGAASAIAGTVATTITGDNSWLNPTRDTLDRIIAEGRTVEAAGAGDGRSALLGGDGLGQTLLVPQRFGRGGWFDYRPLPYSVPVALWTRSLADPDRARIDLLGDTGSGPFWDPDELSSKEDNGHEQPWLAFLEGVNPTYPEKMLSHALSMVERLVQRVIADDADVSRIGHHHWQEHDPLTAEALIQLTLGGPPPLYNGGLLLTAVRHFDPVKRRPGLPTDVAALVTRFNADGVAMQLANLDERGPRSLVVQAGSLAEHRFTTVRLNRGTPVVVDSCWLRLELPASSTTCVELGWRRYAAGPTYGAPPYDRIAAIKVPAAGAG